MTLTTFPKPRWLTFDCYGTLIQWDEGLLAQVRQLLQRKGATQLDPDDFVRRYDIHEHALEQSPTFINFREVSQRALQATLGEIGASYAPEDAAAFVTAISEMPPFAEVRETLGWLKQQGFSLCIVSNTDDEIIAGNVAQLGGHIDRVITAQQARAYKPDPQLFEHAHRSLGVERSEVLHICASPHLDLVAARDMGFHCIWIDRGTARQPLADYRPDAQLPTLDALKTLFAELGWTSG